MNLPRNPLVVAMELLGRRPERGYRLRTAVRYLAAAALPAAACGAGVLLYNWLRFRSLLEFGKRYQLGDRYLWSGRNAVASGVRCGF